VAKLSDNVIETIPIDSVQLHPDNANQGDVGAIVSMIEARDLYGVIQVQRSTNRILAGNHRWKAAKAAGLTEIRVEWQDITDLEATALMVADNRATALSTTDDAQLAKLLTDLAQNATLDGTGFDGSDLDNLLHDLGLESDRPAGAAGDPEPTAADAAQKKWKVKLGDVWDVGAHVLKCGDATDVDSWKSIGDDPDVIFTSPPYLQQRDYGAPIDDWDSLMIGVFKNALAAGAQQLFCNLGMVHKDGVIRYWDKWLDWMADNDAPLFGWYVWDQLHGMPRANTGRNMTSHEFVFHFAPTKRIANKTKKTVSAGTVQKRPAQRLKDGSRQDYGNQTIVVNAKKVPDSVIRVSRQSGNTHDHPAVFPVAFAVEVIESYASPKDVVLDPFCGSGSTLLACEHLGLAGRGIELEPKYVAVTLQRLVDIGLEPVLRRS
jgi:DNA modification methylase